MRPHFKYLKSVWISLVIILITEGIIYITIDKENYPYKIRNDSLLTYTYKGELGVGEFMDGVLSAMLMQDEKANLVQIGDSSGKHGVRPVILNRYLKDMGYRYISMSCCAVTWDAYIELAEYYTKHYNKDKTKSFYLVLYFTPYSLPGWHGPHLATKLHSVLNAWYKIFYYTPTEYYRMDILRRVYRYSRHEVELVFETKNLEKISKNTYDVAKYPPLMDSEEMEMQSVKQGNYAQQKYFLEFFKANLGWLPYYEKLDRKKDMPVGNSCGAMSSVGDLYKGKKILKEYLGKIKNVVTKNGGKLIVIVNPVACVDGDHKSQFIIDQFEEFRKENPDVIVPFDFITTWKPEDFSDQWHLKPELSIKNSNRIGKELKKVLSPSK